MASSAYLSVFEILKILKTRQNLKQRQKLDNLVSEQYFFFAFEYFSMQRVDADNDIRVNPLCGAGPGHQH